MSNSYCMGPRGGFGYDKAGCLGQTVSLPRRSFPVFLSRPACLWSCSACLLSSTFNIWIFINACFHSPDSPSSVFHHTTIFFFIVKLRFLLSWSSSFMDDFASLYISNAGQRARPSPAWWFSAEDELCCSSVLFFPLVSLSWCCARPCFNPHTE